MQVTPPIATGTAESLVIGGGKNALQNIWSGVSKIGTPLGGVALMVTGFTIVACSKEKKNKKIGALVFLSGMAVELAHVIQFVAKRALFPLLARSSHLLSAQAKVVSSVFRTAMERNASYPALLGLMLFSVGFVQFIPRPFKNKTVAAVTMVAGLIVLNNV